MISRTKQRRVFQVDTISLLSPFWRSTNVKILQDLLSKHVFKFQRLIFIFFSFRLFAFWFKTKCLPRPPSSKSLNRLDLQRGFGEVQIAIHTPAYMSIIFLILHVINNIGVAPVKPLKGALVSWADGWGGGGGLGSTWRMKFKLTSPTINAGSERGHIFSLLHFLSTFSLLPSPFPVCGWLCPLCAPSLRHHEQSIMCTLLRQQTWSADRKNKIRKPKQWLEYLD